MATSKTFVGIPLNGNMGTVALTTVEEAITVLAPAPDRGANPEITVWSDVAWLYDHASGAADAARVPFSALQPVALRPDSGSLLFYAKLSAGSGTLYMMRTG